MRQEGGTITNPDNTENGENSLGGIRVTENTEYSSNGKTATIPAGFTVSGLESEQSIDNGLVIYLIPEGVTIDWKFETAVEFAKRTCDQFVWIPIEDINDMYMCQSEDGTKSCNITVVDGKAKCTTHNSEKMAGRLYATSTGEYFNSSLTTQKYTANSGLREPDVLTSYDGNATYLGNMNSILGTNYTSAANFKDALQEEYNEIVKSVYENHGFYVGRYETSNITTARGETMKVVAGATPANNINWYYMYAQQRDYARIKGIETNVGSTMIQGAAYDQVMKFVNTASYDVKATTNVSHNFSSTYQTGGRHYTGSVTYKDFSKNIYDLEGNVSAWTTEARGSEHRDCRGGYYNLSRSASYRVQGFPSYTYSDEGSLPQLYVK